MAPATHIAHLLNDNLPVVENGVATHYCINPQPLLVHCTVSCIENSVAALANEDTVVQHYTVDPDALHMVALRHEFGISATLYRAAGNKGEQQNAQADYCSAFHNRYIPLDSGCVQASSG